MRILVAISLLILSACARPDPLLHSFLLQFAIHDSPKPVEACLQQSDDQDQVCYQARSRVWAERQACRPAATYANWERIVHHTIAQQRRLDLLNVDRATCEATFAREWAALTRERR